jgi:Prophage minor tail protein Z (GPZ)
MATASFTITVNAEAYVNSLGAIAKPKLDHIVALALVDTAKSAKVKAAQAISKRTGLKSALVKERIYYPRVDDGEYQVEIKSSKRPIALIDFPNVMQTATGVSTRAWGKNQLIRHAFIATMKNGHRGVYRRQTKARLPIEQLWGPTIGGTFATKEVQEVVAKTMRERLSKSLARRMAAAVRMKN